MATIDQEIISFDADPQAAIKKINEYIASLNELDKEYNDVVKSGGDATKIQEVIRQKTIELQKAVNSQVKTLKGLEAQTKALTQTQAAAEKQTNSLTVSKRALSSAIVKTGAVLKSGKLNFANLAKSIGSSAIALSGFNPLVAIASTAIGSIVDALTTYIFSSEESSEKTDSLTESVKNLVPEIAKEKSSLDNLFGVAKDETRSKQQRSAAIAEINKRYGQYLPSLLSEKSSLKEIEAAQKTANKRLIENIVLQGLRAKADDIVTKIVERQIELEEIRGKAQEGRQKRAREFYQEGGEASALRQQQEFLDQFNEQASEIEASQNLDAAKKELDKLSKTYKKAAQQIGEALSGIDLSTFQGIEESANSLKLGVQDSAKATAKSIDELNKNSLAALERELGRINKLIREQTDLADQTKLNQLSEEYRKVENQIKEAKAALDLLLNPETPKAKPLNLIEADDLRQVVSEAQQKANIEQLRLENERLELSQKRQELALKRSRNKQVEAARGDAELLAKIDADYEKQKQKLDDDTQRKVLNNRLAILEIERNLAQNSEAELLKIDKQVTEIALELAQLDGKQIKLDVSPAEDNLKNFVGRVLEVVNALEGLSSQISTFFTEQATRVKNQYEQAVQTQKSALENLLSNGQNASVQQVKIEQERLENLQKEREKAANREAALIKLQIAANAALGIAKAVAQGGGLGSAITVASALAALVFGFAKARQEAEQAFFMGSDFVRRGPNEPKGRDTVKARLNEGEAVISTKTNQVYSPTVKAIRRHLIPAEILNRMALDFTSNPDLAKKRWTPKQQSKEFAFVGLNNSNGVNINVQPSQQNFITLDERGYTIRQRRLIEQQKITSKKNS